MNSIDIAMKMETDAVAFYREGASKTSNPICKKMFLSVAEDEKRHITYLKQILEGMDFKPSDASPMKNIRTIFEENKDEMLNRISATTDEMEAFRISMQMEKEGAEFYRKAAASASTPKEKALFERLVKEEEQHYAIFETTYTYLHDTGLWFMWEERSIYEG